MRSMVSVCLHVRIGAEQRAWSYMTMVR
jgi:hypothetical protein